MEIGPSPRVRGSPLRIRGDLLRGGSIPACAGEPGDRRPVQGRRRVHPRVCGGAAYHRQLPPLPHGPSPRVRGSLALLADVRPPEGSIPACAGEPHWCCSASRAWRVHPRVCGGALSVRRGVRRFEGPSPRVRGSRPGSCARLASLGSIPACAGEPESRYRQPCPNRVHPRVCGGASASMVLSVIFAGPSPRVRGSPVVRTHVERGARSIPACAGEPTLPTSSWPKPRVHPRVCGGAILSFETESSARGPSPRVRGSHEATRVDGVRDGSIPACAGEPCR